MRNIDYKYFLYARKSSESEDRQMASIEDQIAEVKKVAEKYNLKIVDIISEAKSAKEPGRVGFNSMLKRIHKGEAQGILTWKLNRLARNPIDGGQISWMLQQNIIKHIQTFEREYKPSDNVLLMQVEFGMANQYVKDLSLDIRRGMRKKAERGWYPKTPLPIGYMHKPAYILGVDDEIVSDPRQFSQIKNLWNLLLTGKYSVADIRRKGNTIGLQNKKGKSYSKNAYYSLFTNEFYCGYYSWKDKDGNLIKYKGKHEAIISQADFQKAQSILSCKTGSIARKRVYDFPYRGIITCGECGSKITPDHKLQVICTKCKFKFSIKTRSNCPKCETDISAMKNLSIVDILYYHCTKSKGKCSQGSITRKELESTIENELKKISINKEFFEKAIEVLKNEDKNKAEFEIISEKLELGKKEINDRISGLINIRANGEITSEQFNSSMSKSKSEISSIEFEIEEIKRQKISWFDEKKKDLDFAKNALEKFQNGNDSVKNEVVREFASNLTLSDRKLYVTIRKSLLELGSVTIAKQLKNCQSNLKKVI